MSSSGHWRGAAAGGISVEDTPMHQVRVTGGFNPFRLWLYVGSRGEARDSAYTAVHRRRHRRGVAHPHRFERTKILPMDRG